MDTPKIWMRRLTAANYSQLCKIHIHLNLGFECEEFIFVTGGVLSLLEGSFCAAIGSLLEQRLRITNIKMDLMKKDPER